MRVLFFVIFLSFFHLNSASAVEQVGGHTNISIGMFHGVQVEYFSKNGSNFLWYPGNNVIVSGRWKLSGKNICFKYQSSSYNPATKKSGGQWECETRARYWNGVEERVKNDPFKLSQRQQVPFVLDKKKTTLAKIARKLGVGLSHAELPVGTPNSNVQGFVGVPMNTPKATCEQVMNNQDRSAQNALLAAGVILRGKWMGKNCVKPDPVLAFEIYEKHGRLKTLTPYIRDQKQRAAQGNAYSQSVLKKLKKSGYIE